MAYSKITWNSGDVITAEKLNNIEEAVEDVSLSVDDMASSIAKINNIESTVESLNAEIASARNYNSSGTANTLGGRIDELVRISNTQPGGNNEIWVNSNSNTIMETQVPTYNEFEALRDSIAQEYSESALYSIGDYVIHEEQLYRCTTEITTAETWNDAHWTQVVFGDEVIDLKSANAYPIVENSNLTHNNGTFNGVTFSWDADNETLTLNDTALGAFFTNLYVNYNVLPGEMKAGETYYVTVDNTSANSFLSILVYAPGETLIAQYNFNGNTFFTVPSNAVGAIVRVTGASGTTFENDTVSDIGIYNTKRNVDLSTFLDTEYAGKNVRVVAGVIRNSGDGWTFINDTGHNPINLDRIGYDANGNIVVYFGFTAKKVLSFIAAPDDDFAKLYTCGSSVGLEWATISLYSIPQIVGGLITYADGAWNTQFSTFNLARSVSGNIVEVTHPAVPSADTAEWFDITCTSWRGKFSAYVQSVTAQSFQVKMFDLDGNEMAMPPAGAGLVLTRTTPTVRQDARNIVSSTGNIWIYGVLEI